MEETDAEEDQANGVVERTLRGKYLKKYKKSGGEGVRYKRNFKKLHSKVESIFQIIKKLSF